MKTKLVISPLISVASKTKPYALICSCLDVSWPWLFPWLDFFSFPIMFAHELPETGARANWTTASVTLWTSWIPVIKEHMIVHGFLFWFWCGMIMNVDWIDELLVFKLIQIALICQADNICWIRIWIHQYFISIYFTQGLVAHAILSLTSWHLRCIAQFATCPGWCSRAPVARDYFVVVVCGNMVARLMITLRRRRGTGILTTCRRGCTSFSFILHRGKLVTLRPTRRWRPSGMS